MEYKLTQLKNGARVIVVSTPAFTSLNFNVTVRGGSSIEDKKNNGISHFVEHMMFQGNRKFPDKDKFDEDIELLGGDYNGSTYRHKVMLKLALPDNKMDYGLEYLYETAYHATFEDKMLEIERRAILDEIHNHNTSPYKKFNDFWDEVRYKKDFRPLDLPGTRSGIQRMPKSKLLSWYKYLMSPNNMTISVVGNLDCDQTIKSVEKFFAEKENHEVPISEATYSKPQLSDFSIKTQVDRKEKQSIGTISFPSYSMYGEDYKTRQTAKILEAVIANYRSSILFKKLRKELGLIYSISADQYFGETSPGVLEFNFTTSDDLIGKVYEITLEELAKLRKDGLDQKLWNLGVESGNNALKMGYSSLGQVIGWFTPSVFWFNKVMTLEEAIQTRRDISLDYANEVLRNLLDTSKINIISRVNSNRLRGRLEKQLETKLNSLEWN